MLAGLLETGWALGLKYSDGFTRPVPSVITFIGALASFWLLSAAMKELPVGNAYAVWVGIGTVGTTVMAVILLGEPCHDTSRGRDSPDHCGDFGIKSGLGCDCWARLWTFE